MTDDQVACTGAGTSGVWRKDTVSAAACVAGSVPEGAGGHMGYGEVPLPTSRRKSPPGSGGKSGKSAYS